MKAAGIWLALVAVSVTGCSGASLPSITTGSILGGPEKPVAAADPSAVNDPTNRAFQVGTVSAKAIKCGFNFDPAKLKNNYLTYERSLAAGADMAKIEKVYDVSFNGVAKAVAGDADYCSEGKTKAIKVDLSRHLAGDFSPAPRPKVAAQDSDSIFGNVFSGDSSSDAKEFKATLPTDNRND